jgi:hypothetical protein
MTELWWNIALVSIIMLLARIIYLLQAERQRHIRQEEILREVWFRQYGRYTKTADCDCSATSPCMAHYGRYHRWAVGATEAEAMAQELAFLLNKEPE